MASKQEEEGEEEEEREGEEFASSDSERGEEGSDYEEQDDEEIEQEGDEPEENQACSSESPSSDQDRKSQNVAALLRGNLHVRRQPLIPRILSVSDGAAVARKPFKPPCSKRYKDQNDELSRRLWARKRFVPWGSSAPRRPLVAIDYIQHPPSINSDDPEREDQLLPPGIEPLILWQADGTDKTNDLPQIEVDALLVRYLRPHQREGVQFMFECVSGLSGSDGVSGCILADDMGLGKTLQSITLLYTLLRQGFDGKPMVKRAMIVTPTSLVSNWESEIDKWIGRKIRVVALCETTRADVLSGIESFLNPCSAFQVLIISYETFRMHSSKFDKNGSCDLLICDEAHRLKNDQTLTNRALGALPCLRRVLLSGTPMQNDLEEFFAMVNFTNPGILGDASYFRRYYEAPIISGREPTATLGERKLGIERSAELSAKVNQFILRRTNTLLSNHLPPKIIEVVCCRLTPLQLELYNHFIQSKNVKRVISEEMKQSKILAYITALKKLCNHPKLIYDSIKSDKSGTSGFSDCIRFFPPELFSGRSGTWTGGAGVWVELSGKMHVLARLLGHLRQKTDDRIVLVSNYTQTLDLFAQLCRERRYPFLRLDGTTSIGKRQKLVNYFNDPSKDEFAFLLSSKAGGCGLNLIGGNRLVLFDPDWNPANDKQAAARVWRDGQKKRVYIYRFLSTGTIEEKVYQRQMSKEGLQKVIQKEQAESEMPQGNFFSAEDLRDLFTFHENVRSEIHENMNCARCKKEPTAMDRTSNEIELDNLGGSCEGKEQPNVAVNDIGGFAQVAGCSHKLQSSQRQLGTPSEEDLGSWGHHPDPATVPDAILQLSAGDEVAFVFTNQVDGKLVPVESASRSQNQNQTYGNLMVSANFKQQNQNTRQKSLATVGTTVSWESKSIRRTLPKLHAIEKPNASFGGLSSLKRTPTSALSDDDFT
ncbi:DNA repair and recombination protein RAD54-like [Zingiber officinale]|uniref:DNA repair and recombination protein RAD54-like n=1 Tax=Zingiber officinale TaxID=94328 RepID=UPI001C4BC544|nr:DNA repair and recombination protein RAD54-like [Zingiber officinale]